MAIGATAVADEGFRELTRHEKHSNLAMAGEFFVAAQLQRLGLGATVTYGNAKRADVIALSLDRTRAVVIEVKTSSRGRWIIGSQVPHPSNQPWVFVHMPEMQTQAPEFFVLLQKELHEATIEAENAFKKRYLEKHGVPWNKKGVANVSRAEIERFQDNWDCIQIAVRTSKPRL